MRLERFIEVDGRRMRLGYTTGSCATLAAAAAARALLGGRFPETVSLATPKGIAVAADVVNPVLLAECASCAVRKDAGDDPDATHGVLVYARVERKAAPGIDIRGGEGVGRVTRPGLDQPVGEAAVNSGPRATIAHELDEIGREFGYAGGWIVTVSIPEGETIARRTFNPELGIVGGLSVIGTTGIVEPMSGRAVADTIRAAMSVIRAEGGTRALATPGNYGGAFVRDHPVLSRWPGVKCANFVGEAIDIAGALGFTELLLVGHVGKLVKVAGGILDTHSRVADGRLDVLALHAALAGRGKESLRAILDCATVDAALDVLTPAERAAVGASLAERAEAYMNRRAKGRVACGAAMFSHAHNLFAAGERAREFIGIVETT